MSTYYYFYAEVRYRNKWYNLNPIVNMPNKGYRAFELMYGASSMREFVNDLEDSRIGCGIPDDMCEELRAMFDKDLDAPCDYGWCTNTYREYYEQVIFYVNFDAAVNSKVVRDRNHQHQGYVPKLTIDDFECNTTDYIDRWLTKDEYNALSEEEKLQYAWYEWDNYGDIYGCRKELADKINMLLHWFYQGYAIDDDGKYDVTSECGASSVRVYVYTC